MRAKGTVRVPTAGAVGLVMNVLAQVRDRWHGWIYSLERVYPNTGDKIHAYAGIL